MYLILFTIIPLSQMVAITFEYKEETSIEREETSIYSIYIQ